MFNRFALSAATAAVLAASGLNAFALGAGDIAFTSINTQEDGVSFVALADIAANTTIFFTDNEWVGTLGAGGAFNAGESYNKWVSGAATVAAGTVVRFANYDATTLSSSVGTLSRETVSGNTNWGISTTADTVYAFLGTSATVPTAILAAISAGTDGALTGLGAGVNTILLAGGPEFVQYTGPRSGQTTFAGYSAGLTNTANWSAPVSNAAAIPNTTSFTIAAVPEPSTYALLLAGIAAVGFMARRRA